MVSEGLDDDDGISVVADESVVAAATVCASVVEPDTTTGSIRSTGGIPITELIKLIQI